MILRLALLLCPPEFRREYADQVAADAAESGSVWSTAFDVARTGIAMRFETLGRELARAARSLSRAPLFSGIVILTLALAISVNAAVFGIFDAVVHQSLPVAGADRLVLLCAGSCQGQISNPDIAEVAKSARSFTDVSAYQMLGQTLTGIGRPSKVEVGVASPNVFTGLGIKAEVGTLFDGGLSSSTDDVVVSHKFWVDRLGEDRNVVGRTIVLDDTPHRILGVAPNDAAFPTPFIPPTPNLFAVWEVLRPSTFVRGPGAFNDWAFARLAPGATIASANADLRRIVSGIAAEHPADERGLSIKAVGLRQWYASSPERTLLLAFFAAFAILLIACANVANLMLARTTARRHEYAIRAALGAWRSRIVGELTAEIVVLTSVALVLGLAVASFELRLAGGFGIVFAGVRPAIGSLAVLLTLAAVVVAICAGGILPAYFSTGTNLESTIRGGGRGAPVARLSFFRAALSVAEIALAFSVVVTSVLLFKGFLGYAYPDLGANANHVYSTEATLFADRYKSDAARAAFAQTLSKQLARLPGVVASTIALGTPLTADGSDGGPFRLIDHAYAPGKAEDGTLSQVMPNYFSVLEIPLVAGRSFAPYDRLGSAPVAILSHALSVRLFHGNAVGRRILLERPDKSYRAATIVGIAGDVHPWGMPAGDTTIYVPFMQWPGHIAQIVVRAQASNGDDGSLDRRVGNAIASADPREAVDMLFSWQWLLAARAQPEHTGAILLAMLAGVAFLLALAGIYGVVSYGVEQRWHEFGVRMAVGATPGCILKDVLGKAMGLALLGIATGITLTALCSRFIASQIYPASPFDLPVFVVVAVCVAATLLLASWIPARRATRLDPSSTLRYE